MMMLVDFLAGRKKLKVYFKNSKRGQRVYKIVIHEEKLYLKYYFYTCFDCDPFSFREDSTPRLFERLKRYKNMDRQ